MSITKENFINTWENVSGFDFRKLMEDDKQLSVPMPSIFESSLTIFAFVYSQMNNGNIVVFEKHYWNDNGHKVFLCNDQFNLNFKNDKIIADNDYFAKLSDALPFLFKENLSNEEKLTCKKYIDLFSKSNMNNIYYSENRGLFQWIKINKLV